VHENLKHGPSQARKQADKNDMQAKGLTNYAAWPLYHRLDKRHTVMRPCDQFFMHQHRVLAVVRLDNPRDNTREQGPIDFAAFTGAPGGMAMAFVRCYTGADGQSHFEDLDLLPPDLERSIEQAASSITFTRSPNGRFSDWHNAPRRQYAIFLSGGQMKVVIGDGTIRRFGPGDAVLFEDLRGQGHTSRSVGGDRLTAIVPLAD
jgi:hypothetical protein